MKDKLNKFTQNLIRLAVLERVHQLEEKSDNLNVLDKQLELEDLGDEIILRANKAPLGLVEVVFTDQRVRDDMNPDEIIRNCQCRICGFNTEEVSKVKSMFRTVIVVDAKWSSNLRVYQSEYGLPNNFLK